MSLHQEEKQQPQPHLDEASSQPQDQFIRYPDIIVISWRCVCGFYMSHSIDTVQTERLYPCSLCSRTYLLQLHDVDVNVDIIQGQQPIVVSCAHCEGSLPPWSENSYDFVHEQTCIRPSIKIASSSL